MPRLVRFACVAYLACESAALVLYWILLAMRPELRGPFVPPGGDDRSLFAFALGDLALYGSTGVIGMAGILRRAAWRRAVLWTHAGAAMYAACFAISLWPMASDRWLGALLMAPALVCPLAIAAMESVEPTTG